METNEYTPWGKYPQIHSSNELKSFFTHNDILNGFDKILENPKSYITPHLLTYLIMILKLEITNKEMENFSFIYEKGKGSVLHYLNSSEHQNKIIDYIKVSTTEDSII
jgi:hypothetical protein